MLEVLEGGLSVVEVARRFGVVRQTVHGWLRDYARDGIMGLADRSSKPATCPHQMLPEVEALVVSWPREHPSWGPQTILYELGRAGVDPLPGRTSVYRALVRHGLIDPKQRRRRRSDYKRWERSRAMELWQKDITGGVHLVDGSQASVVTGLDDNSRFCVCANVVRRATAGGLGHLDHLPAVPDHFHHGQVALLDHGELPEHSADLFPARLRPKASVRAERRPEVSRISRTPRQASAEAVEKRHPKSLRQG